MRLLRQIILTLAATLSLAVAAGNGTRFGCAERFYYNGPAQVADSCVAIELPDIAGADLGVEASVALPRLRERAGISAHRWSLLLAAGVGDTVKVALTWGNTDFGAITDRRFTRLEVWRGEECLFTGDPDGFTSSPGLFNTLRADLGVDKTHLIISGGGPAFARIADLRLDKPLHVMSAAVSVVGKAEVSLLAAEVTPGEEAYMTCWNEQLVAEHLSEATDPVTGYWTFLDRENHPDYARPGGRYTLAVVASETGHGFDILYIDGARVLASKWKPFMLKGHLRPTAFSNHYELQWLDSEFRPILADIHADVTDGAILTLSFPLYRTTLRFAKASVPLSP